MPFFILNFYLMPLPKGHFIPCLYVSATLQQYRIISDDGELINKDRVFPDASVPVMNFLGVCHALAYLKKIGTFMPIYTNLNNTIIWVNKGECTAKERYKEEVSMFEERHANPLYNHLVNAEEFLKSHQKELLFITKWETKEWGEIPTHIEKND